MLSKETQSKFGQSQGSEESQDLDKQSRNIQIAFDLEGNKATDSGLVKSEELSFREDDDPTNQNAPAESLICIDNKKRICHTKSSKSTQFVGDNNYIAAKKMQILKKDNGINPPRNK